jgi:FkbM family methyltransferase
MLTSSNVDSASDQSNISPITLIVHVGAHIGQEVETYRSLGIKTIVWVEADPETYKKLKSYITQQETSSLNKINHFFVNALVSDKDGESIEFHKFNNDGQSSSRFKPTEILKMAWPGLDVIGAPQNFQSYRLDTILNNLNLNGELFTNPKLVLDVQGGEYQALVGLGNYIDKFSCIEIEISRSEIYQGQTLFETIDNFLALQFFSREIQDIKNIPWHGNITYKRPVYATMIIEQCKKYFTSLYAFREIGKNINLQTNLTRFVSFCAENVSRSYAQLFQDLLVIFLLKNKRGGFFVEFGATNGIYLSNSYLLEKDYGWNGILCEPAISWHTELEKMRLVTIDKRCVYSESDKYLEFIETSNQELSTLADFSNSDLHSSSRAEGHKYNVKTISLEDLLDCHRSPEIIDYISIDTEGSEYEILSTFNFEKYKFRIITIEHNFTDMREKIYALLINKGYARIFTGISAFDDWYIHTDLISFENHP